jgi:hypothetical protein
MTAPSVLQHVLFEAETPSTGYAENVTTFGGRLPVLGTIDLAGLTRTKMAPEWMVQRRNDGHGHIKGENDVTWTMRGRFPGHGSSTAGSGLTMSTLGTWLGDQIGIGALAHTAGTTISGGTATAPTVALASGYAAGCVLRVGARNDGDGGGQFHRVLTHSASTINLANALMGAPVNGAVVYTAEQLYPLETVNTVPTYRYQIGSGNQRYNIHGGFSETIGISGLNPGEFPTWEAGMRGAAAYPTTGGAWPTATAVVQNRPAHVANGSLTFAEVGSTTRVAYDIRDFQLTYTLGINADKGPGGIWDGQTIMSVRRTPDTCTGSFYVDASTASAAPFWHSAWDDESKEYQLMWTGNTEDGKALGISLQRVCLTGPRPSQLDNNQINRVPVQFTAYSGATTTSDLTTAMMIIAMA